MSKHTLVMGFMAAGWILPQLLACGFSDHAEPLTVTDAGGQKRFMPDEDGHLRAVAQGQHGHFAVSVSWDLPGRTATLNFSDSTGAPAAQVSDVRVRLSMPEHGHDGAGVPKTSHLAVSPWIWQVTSLAPSMSGDWLLHVDAVVLGKADRAAVLLHFPAVTGEHVSAHH